jgi:peptidoglycan/LPS O-acetylase OafA/YrhL
MFFTIVVVTSLALSLLAVASRRPSWEARREPVRIAAVAVLGGATLAAFRTEQSALFSVGLLAGTLVAAAYTAWTRLAGSGRPGANGQQAQT